MAPKTAGRSLLSHGAIVALSVTALMFAQRCFLSSAPVPPTKSDVHVQPAVDHAAALPLMEADFAAGPLFAGSEALALEGADRDVKVAMYNKKRTKRDRSEGWTFRKKFRSCSLLARAATVKGRKILKKRMWRGKKVLAPGDYCNYKMQRVKNLR